VTADDFGASPEVNRAVEQAHRDGILTCASLMVGAPAADDAVARARALPSLRVGLHLVLVCGRPVLPPAAVPDLVGPDGRFSERLVRAGFSFFFRPRVRAQLTAEIRAQFERFAATGLSLDHANAHNHMHLHPTVLGLMLRIGTEFGLAAVRLPHEPFLASWRGAGEGFAGRLAGDLALRPLRALFRWRLRRAGVACNDQVFGMNDSGAMDRARLGGFLDHLPDGVTELYLHPATAPWPGMDAGARHYRVADELAALTDPGVAARLAASGAAPTSFSALAAGMSR